MRLLLGDYSIRGASYHKFVNRDKLKRHGHHSIATTLLEHGMPLEQIQKFLGHAKIDTTQIYAASTTAMIKESYRQALSR